VHYGFGWAIRELGNGRGVNMWHNGSLPGTSTLLVRRSDGINWAILFNTRDSSEGKALSDRIDPLLHRAAAEVRSWPDRELP
jgi:N-acyl-D-amino-acid deacylase